MSLERGALFADTSITGAAWCRAYSDLVDEWLDQLLRSAVPDSMEGLALVALGGYGRAELAPASDIDVMLVHDRRCDIASVADRVWYPIWDQSIHLGHSVSTIREALNLAADDLDTATSLLSARHVSGDPGVTTRLAQAGRDAWEKRSKRWLTELGASVEIRHEKAGEVAFRLEPDLKEGRGGLRDVHALWWAQLAQPVLLDPDIPVLEAAYATLLDVRVELHRRTDRATNVLAVQEQDAVAKALGKPNADALIREVAEAAKAIAWTSDDTWRRTRSKVRGPLGRLHRRTRPIGDGLSLRDGEVHVDDEDAAGHDPLLALRAAVAAAAEHTFIDRYSLELLADAAPPLPDPWPPEARGLLVALLLTGRPVIRVIEALDQRGVWSRILPEWVAVSARPQRNPYHRFTVDRHLLEAAANAASLVSTVDRPDLLVLGALLHDIGKGYDGDHTQVGVTLVAGMGARMGLPDGDVGTLVSMVEHHLLLPDVATRRDLDDPTTIERVARTVGSLSTLRLLAALTEADSLATGPAAWGPSKAELVGQLAERVARRLEGSDPDHIVEPFPTTRHLARLAGRGRQIDTDDETLTVVADDRPGLFSRVAGVLALHGLDVVRAAAHSTENGRALAEFHVHDPRRSEIPWPRVTADLELVLDGRLALNARISERVKTYGRRPSTAVEQTTVTFDDDASSNSTVIDVQSADGIGVLYRITRALVELDLDIRSAKVQTLGHHVVDAFYVRDAGGAKITDPRTLDEIERAIVHSIADGRRENP